MKWPKDRKKAFRWAAEAFGTPYEKRTERQKELTCYGICWAIYKLTNSYVGARQICDLGNKTGIEDTYWWPCKRTHDKERSLFCYLMATLSAKEFEEISG